MNAPRQATTDIDMNQQTQFAEAIEVSGGQELSLEPQPTRPLVAQHVASLPSTVVTPGDLLRIAVDSGDKDIERLERLMAMQERYREAQERDRLRDAEIAFEADFVGFTGENICIPKTKMVNRGKAGSFAQAEFDEVCNRIKPALARHGFGIRHKETFGAKTLTIDGVEKTLPWVWVVCILSHRCGHKDILELDGPADDQSANTLVQNSQSTATYLKRQSMLAITGTPTGGEDDENRPSTGQDGAPQSAQADAEGTHKITLRNAGEAAAAGGMQALTAWWAELSPREQKDMSPEFSAMRKAARAADQGTAR